MAMRVVELLEVIDVQDSDRARGARLHRGDELRAVLEEMPAVEEAGEIVPGRQLLQLLQLRKRVRIVCDPALQLFGHEGAGDEIIGAGLEETGGHGEVGRRRDTDHAHLVGGEQAADLAGQHVAVHVRHVVVADHQLDVGIGREERQGLGAGAGLDDRVLLDRERPGEVLARRRHVVDDEDARLAVRQGALHRRDQRVQRELVVLQDIVDDVARHDPAARFDVEASREDDGRDAALDGEVDRLAVGRVRQVQVDHGDAVGFRLLGDHFMQLVQGGAGDDGQLGLVGEQLAQRLREGSRILDDQNLPRVGDRFGFATNGGPVLHRCKVLTPRTANSSWSRRHATPVIEKVTRSLSLGETAQTR
jgi:hypothetical protein